MSTTVLPRLAQRAHTSQAARRAAGSKPVVGSSRKISSGSPTSASAKSSRRALPAGERRARRSAASCQSPPARSPRRRRAGAGTAPPSARRVSRTVRCGYVPQLCSTIPTRARSAAGRAAGVLAEHRDLAGVARRGSPRAPRRWSSCRRRWARAARTPRRADGEVDAPHRLVVAVGLAQAGDLDRAGAARHRTHHGNIGCLDAVRLHRHRVEHHARAGRRARRAGRSARCCSSARSPASAAGCGAGGAIPRGQARRDRRVVAEQLALARAAGRDARCARSPRPRSAARANRDELVDAAVRRPRASRWTCSTARRRRGSPSSAPRARSAAPLAGPVAVVDVGGGSTEIAVGHARRPASTGGSRSASAPGSLADALPALRPADARRAAARRARTRRPCSTGSTPPPVDAPSPSAAARRRCAACRLGADTSSARPRARACSRAAPAAEVAARFELEPERVRLLPAGLLALEAAGRALGSRCRSATAACARACCSSSRALPRLPRWRRPREIEVSPGSPTPTPRRGSCACAREELFEQAEGVLDTEDIERVHDMRVATPPAARGAGDLRAVLPAAAASSGVLSDVKALADALGRAARPRRRSIAALEALAAAAPGGRPAGRATCSSSALRARQAHGQRDARRGARRHASAAICACGCWRWPTPRAAAHEGAQGQGARPGRRRSPTTPSASSARGSTSCAASCPRRADPSEVAGAARHAHRRQAPALRARGHGARCFGEYADDGGQARQGRSRTCSARSTTATCRCRR